MYESSSLTTIREAATRRRTVLVTWAFWADSFFYEPTFAIGTVPTAQNVDAQVDSTIKSLHTTAQMGGINLFDVTNYQVYGAPSFGCIVYFELLFDIKQTGNTEPQKGLQSAD